MKDNLENIEVPFKQPMSRRRFLAWGGASTAGLIGFDAFWHEPHALVVEELDLPLPKIPPGREIRLLHLSDLHIRSFGRYYREVAEKVMRLRPEAILLTGDYLEKQRNLRGVLDFLHLLQAPKGIFAVQGNWEYWARVEGENLRRHFAGENVSLLLNERVDLELAGVPFSLLGLDYPSAADHLRFLQDQSDRQRVNLLLSHVPAFDHELLDDRIDLILSGHTHGGQVRLPFLPPLQLPRYSSPFVAGLYRVGDPKTPMYVSRGVGTSLLPIRFCCRPEITLLRLIPAT